MVSGCAPLRPALLCVAPALTPVDPGRASDLVRAWAALLRVRSGASCSSPSCLLWMVLVNIQPASECFCSTSAPPSRLRRRETSGGRTRPPPPPPPPPRRALEPAAPHASARGAYWMAHFSRGSRRFRLADRRPPEAPLHHTVNDGGDEERVFACSHASPTRWRSFPRTHKHN